MNHCAFTIVATNYVGLAQALESSIAKYNQDVDFYIIVADEPTEIIKQKFNPNVFVAKDILDFNPDKWYEMAFKYNLTEFCTAIKPASFKYFFQKGYNEVAYFDPDILTFSPLNYIWEKLTSYEALLTPHILTPESQSSGNLKEAQLLYSGVYNMGFGAFRNTPQVNLVIEWWNNRLKDFCFADTNTHLFTDQKWVDLIPCFLGEKTCISNHPGLNLAPWNFHERQIIRQGEQYLVTSRISKSNTYNLVFVHYSGYNYKALISGEILQNNILDMKQYEDIACLFKAYGTALKHANIADFIDQRYTYNYFSDPNYEISFAVRRLFRGFTESGNSIGNPFNVNGAVFQRLQKLQFVKRSEPFQSGTYNEQSNKTQHTIQQINKIFRILFKLLGPSRYYNITRALRKFGVWENHSFLMTQKDEPYKFRRL